MNLGSSIVKTSQALEIAPSYSQLQCLHPASTSRLSVLDQDFFPDLSCFRSKAVLKIRPSTCAWKATTAGLASTTTDALIAGLMSLLIPHGTLEQPTVNPAHSELSLASRPTSASLMFPRSCSDGSTSLELVETPNGS